MHAHIGRTQGGDGSTGKQNSITSAAVERIGREGADDQKIGSIKLRRTTIPGKQKRRGEDPRGRCGQTDIAVDRTDAGIRAAARVVAKIEAKAAGDRSGLLLKLQDTVERHCLADRIPEEHQITKYRRYHTAD